MNSQKNTNKPIEIDFNHECIKDESKEARKEEKKTLIHINNEDILKPLEVNKKEDFEICENPESKLELKKPEKENEEIRLCMNLACCKNYKEVENTYLSCQYHYGTWNNGSTGFRMIE